MDQNRPGPSNNQVETWRHVGPSDVTHASTGARQALPGFTYQIKVTMLLLLRAYRSGLDFTAAVENDEAFKFDDIHLTTPTLQHFYQVKYSVTKKPVTFFELFPQVAPGKKGKTNKDFDLREYFQSFKKMTGNFEPSVKNKFIIYTNRDFEYGNKNLGDFVFSCDAFETVREDAVMKCDLLKFKPNFTGKDDVIRTLTGENITPEISTVADKFLQQFYFAINQSTDEDVEELVKSELEQEFGSVYHENLYYKFFSLLNNWFLTKGNKGTFKNKDDLKKFFDDSIENSLDNIFFDIYDPNDNFYGREIELTQISAYLMAPKQHLVDVVVSGLGGVGKSELVRMFNKRNRELFPNVIWINAETRDSLEYSFKQLGIKLKVISPTENSNDIDNLVTNIYDYFKYKKCIFIFDNVEKLFFGEKIRKHFLPKIKEGAPRIIFTSQIISKWQCTYELPLDVFSRLDSVEFLKTELGIGADEIMADLESIADTVEYLPLALQIITAYIKGRKAGASILGKSYTLKNFLDEYEQKAERFLKYKFDDQSMDKYEKPLLTTWELTIENIREKQSGKVAINILNTMAYMKPYRIASNFFEMLSEDEIELSEALMLLKTYSLIKQDLGKVSIHRLVQDVIRQKLIMDNEEINILDKALQILMSVLKIGNNNKTYTNRDSNFSWIFHGHVKTIWEHSSKYDVLIQRYSVIGEKQLFDLRGQVSYRTVDVLIKRHSVIGEKQLFDLCGQVSYKKADFMLKIANAILEPMRKFLETNNSNLIYAEIENANLCSFLCKYEDANFLLDNIIERLSSPTYNSEYLYALASKANNYFRKYEAKNEKKIPDEYDQALDLCFIISKNISKLTTRNDFCNVLMALEIAHNLRKDLNVRSYKGSRRKLATFKIYSHLFDTLRTQQSCTVVVNIALFMAHWYNQSQQYDVAEQILQSVWDVEKIGKDGQNAAETSTLVKQIFYFLFQQKKIQEAKDFYEIILKQAENVKDNLIIINVIYDMSRFLRNLKDDKNSIETSRKVLEFIILKYSENSLDVMKDVNRIESIFRETCTFLSKYYDKPFLNKLLDLSRKKLGNNHFCTKEILVQNHNWSAKNCNPEKELVALKELLAVHCSIQMSQENLKHLTKLAYITGCQCFSENIETVFTSLFNVAVKSFGEYNSVTLITVINYARVLNYHKKYDLATRKLEEILVREKHIIHHLNGSSEVTVEKLTGDSLVVWRKYDFGEGALLLSEIMQQNPGPNMSLPVEMLTEFHQEVCVAEERSAGKKIFPPTVLKKIRERIVELLLIDGKYSEARDFLMQLIKSIKEEKRYTYNYHKYKSQYFLCKAKEHERQNNVKEALLEYDKAFETMRERYQYENFIKIESIYDDTKLLHYFTKKATTYKKRCENDDTKKKLNNCNLWYYIIHSFFVADILMRMAKYEDATKYCELILPKIVEHKNEKNVMIADVSLQDMSDILYYTNVLKDLINLRANDLSSFQQVSSA